jgi:preprotein translocase subunit SecG
MEEVILVIHLLVAVALIAVILLQRTAQDGGGLMGGGGGGTMGGLFTARGSANLLTRTTAILATSFLITSLTLGVIASRKHHERNPTAKLETTQPVTPETPAVPATPQVPIGQ